MFRKLDGAQRGPGTLHLAVEVKEVDEQRAERLHTHALQQLRPSNRPPPLRSCGHQTHADAVESLARCEHSGHREHRSPSKEGVSEL